MANPTNRAATFLLLSGAMALPNTAVAQPQPGNDLLLLTSQPTAAAVTNSAKATPGCTDTPNWEDTHGDTCAYYNAPAICSDEGSGGDGGMGVALDHCCSCGGGVVTAATAGPTLEPTRNPSSPPITTPSPTIKPATSSPTTELTTPSPTLKATSSPTTHKPTSAQIITTPAPTPPAPTTTTSPTADPTAQPTSQPTARDWDNLTPGHVHYCGPKRVGGYAIAKATCSPQTECKKAQAANTAYGSSGNDCPKDLMCFTDIICAPPTAEPSGAPSAGPTQSSVPTVQGQTRAPTASSTVSRSPLSGPPTTPAPTFAPFAVQDSITARGSYCGASFEAARDACAHDRSCTGDEDCSSGEECFINISCTFHASEATANASEKESTDEEGLNGLDFETNGNKQAGGEYAILNSSSAKVLWVGTITVLVASAALMICI